jgi:hypothetical protein
VEPETLSVELDGAGLEAERPGGSVRAAAPEKGEPRWAPKQRGMTVTVNIDELGPVDWIVVEFPGTKLTGEIAPIVKDYVDRGLIKVLDLVFLKKDQDGGLEAFEASDLGDTEIGELRGYERDLAMVLSEQDVADLAETIEPGSSAAVLVWENLWAAPFGAAVRHAGGQLAASGRIPIQAVLAAIEADAGEADAGEGA